jgi:hypothetical protein
MRERVWRVQLYCPKIDQAFLYATFILCGACIVACIPQNITHFREVLRYLIKPAAERVTLVKLQS